MKKILFVAIFSTLTLLSFSQVEVKKWAFNRQTKELLIVLRNQYNDFVFLFPTGDYTPPQGTYCEVLFKNKEKKTIETYSDYLFGRRLGFRLGDSVIGAFEEREYSIKLNRKGLSNIHSVEVILHIDVRNPKKKVRYVNVISEIFEWK